MLLVKRQWKTTFKLQNTKEKNRKNLNHCRELEFFRLLIVIKFLEKYVFGVTLKVLHQTSLYFPVRKSKIAFFNGAFSAFLIDASYIAVASW